MKHRCPWVPENNPGYIDYHDNEWGVPNHDDRVHFEFLILEGAQAGLSWETILKRREGYRRAFADFDPQVVARFDADMAESLRHNEGIIRNRLKIAAAIRNAAVFCNIQAEFGSFDTYIWRFVNDKPLVHGLETMSDYPIYTKEAEALSKDLKARGMNFVGPTIMYAHMQACGLVNDHVISCFRYEEVINEQ